MIEGKCFDLFPLTVYKGTVGLDPNYRTRLLELLQDQRRRADSSKSGSSWTGDVNNAGNLHREPIFSDLATAFKNHLGCYLDNLGVRLNKIDVAITRCWGTLTNDGEKIGRHAHLNSDLSIVYYLKLPTGSSPLTVYLDRSPNEFCNGLFNRQSLAAGVLNNNSLTYRNVNQLDIDIAEDEMLIFPSRLEHGVRASTIRGVRSSIAADTKFTIKAGEQHEFLQRSPSEWLTL